MAVCHPGIKWFKSSMDSDDLTGDWAPQGGALLIRGVTQADAFERVLTK